MTPKATPTPTKPEPPLEVTVACDTTKGVFEIRVVPSWAPLGAQRFLQQAVFQESDPAA